MRKAAEVGGLVCLLGVVAVCGVVSVVAVAFERWRR